MNRDRELQVFLITLLFVALFFFLAYQWSSMNIADMKPFLSGGKLPFD
jgi:hypothetical protein|tara:strand:- start:616 stop:759 length:144 start_codon:yes stop_codon:yes gene_type:complete